MFIVCLIFLGTGIIVGVYLSSDHRGAFSKSDGGDAEIQIAGERAFASESADREPDDSVSLRRTPVVRAVEEVGPAVVNISTEKIVTRHVNPFGGFSNSFSNDLFDRFFDRYYTRNYKQQTLGSGVIIDPRGYILTNDHVILRASEVTVTLPGDEEYDAKIIGADPRFDLAILKIEAGEELPAASTGDSDSLMIGETVIAIGNPFGLSHTVTTGVLSAVNRTIKTQEGKIFNDFIQTDASINPGNSGGPLVILTGEVIGINTIIYENAEGIGFSIPINRAMRAVSELIQFGEIKKTWTGLRVQEMNRALARQFGLSKVQGALVSHVISGSPAARAGIREGDVILEVNGKNLKSADEFMEKTGASIAGETIDILLLRDGNDKNISLRMEALPIDRAEELGRERFGVKVDSITRTYIRRYNLRTDRGVIVLKVDSGSPADEIGITTGDVIRKIGVREIVGIDDYRETAVQAAERESVFMVVQRGSYLYNIRL